MGQPAGGCCTSRLPSVAERVAREQMAGARSQPGGAAWPLPLPPQDKRPSGVPRGHGPLGPRRRLHQLPGAAGP
eukprot:5696127-Pyramimonas_sp.AAC.1